MGDRRGGQASQYDPLAGIWFAQTLFSEVDVKIVERLVTNALSNVFLMRYRLFLGAAL
jgi:hypothetical protein